MNVKDLHLMAAESERSSAIQSAENALCSLQRALDDAKRELERARTETDADRFASMIASIPVTASWGLANAASYSATAQASALRYARSDALGKEHRDA